MPKNNPLSYLLLVVFLNSACNPITIQPTITPGVQSSERMNIPIESDLTIKGWIHLLPFDAIRPVYEPRFISAEEAGLALEELIMGVSWVGEAKAYSVSVLRSREMVNDEMAGIPYLVSW